MLSEIEFACTLNWESDLCFSISSLPPSYAWAEAVVYLPISHRHPVLEGQMQQFNYKTVPNKSI